MSERPIQFDDISPLLSALCDGSLSAGDRMQFEQLLEHDGLARKWYVAYMDLHGELCFGHMPALELDNLAADRT